jgi:hypothetical protein
MDGKQWYYSRLSRGRTDVHVDLVSIQGMIGSRPNPSRCGCAGEALPNRSRMPNKSNPDQSGFAQNKCDHS